MRLIVRLAVILSIMSARVLAQSSADSASVTAFYGKWFGSVPQGTTAYASFYSPDGYILPPGSAPISGRAAIAAWMEQTSAAATYVTKPQGITVDEMRFISPALVVYRSTLRGERVAKAGGQAVLFETKYFDLLGRAPSGEWEVLYRMWSDNR